MNPDPKKAEAGRKGGLKRQDNWRRGVKECEWCENPARPTTTESFTLLPLREHE